jgi:hypothetical protein
MVAKKTNKGRISMLLTWDEREALWGALANYLERGSVAHFLNKRQAAEGLLLYTLNDLMVRRDFRLQVAADHKMIISMAEAIGLVMLLADYDSEQMLLNIKSQLHKLLN